MSIDEIKIKYDFINQELSKLRSELKTISVTTFELNPRILELTSEIKKLEDERTVLLDKIKSNNENEVLED